MRLPRTAVLGGLLLGLLAGGLTPAPPATAAPGAAGGTGLVGTSPAGVLPVSVVGGAAVVPPELEHRLGRVGGSVARLAGDDRFATAVAVVRSTHPAGAAEVVLASGTAFPDALVAGPLAAALDAPLLLVAPGSLPGPVAAELARLSPGRITVVGGPGVVGEPVLAAARAAAGGESVAVRRLWGADRYLTAVAVARTFAPGTGGVVLATGRDFPDGLAATPLAGALGGPVLLTTPTALPVPVRDDLARLAPGRLVVAGGSGAVSDAVAAQAGAAAGRPAERAAGADRYATATALARVAHDVRPATSVLVATGAAFPDALAAGAAAATGHGVVLLGGAGPRASAEVAAAVGRLRGLSPWVQLVLDLLARVRALAETWRTAYRAAYTADTLALLYGWSDPEVVAELAVMRSARKPGGGYGLDRPYDWLLDGTTNPASTAYLVTITDHVGRALLDGLRAGAVPAAEVAEQVDAVLAWPRVDGDPGCLAYSDSGTDAGRCVYNVSSGAGWFLATAWDLGVRRPGQRELATAIAGHDAAAYDGTGWWPYSSAHPDVRQDWNHNAWTVEAHLTLSPGLGADALARVMAGGPTHPDDDQRRFDDPMGYLRLLPYACDRRTGLADAARDVAARQQQASATAQLALWAARTAQACGG